MDLDCRVKEKNACLWDEMLPEAIEHFVQGPCYQWGSSQNDRMIQAAIGEYDELLTLIKKRKLRWFGHVSMSSGLAKTILQGTVKGKRWRGRQKRRYEGNIKEWTGIDFASSTRAAENRTRWKGLLRTHLWCPDDLTGLCDRIEIDKQMSLV